MTRDYVHEHFAKHPGERYTGMRVAPRIICADGFSLSVQASTGHYCSPKNTDGPYTLVEVGFPETAGGQPARPRALGSTPDCGVWGYTPVGTVNNIIRRHGGVKEA